jgi:hypothetical protein
MLNDLQNEGNFSPKLEPAVQEFLNSLDNFEALVSKFHFKVRTHSDRSLQRFSSLPKEIQAQIVKNFTGYQDFLTKCSSSGLDLRDDQLLLKAYLTETGFIYDRGIFDNISRGDVIEIYTKDQIQIFRNLAFMDLCNYTLLDLLSYDPYELYERSEKVKQYLMEVVNIVANRPRSTLPIEMSHVPSHVLREKFSDQRLTSSVQFKWVYPLYKWPNQEMTAFIAVQTGCNIAQASPELSFL